MGALHRLVRHAREGLGGGTSGRLRGRGSGGILSREEDAPSGQGVGRNRILVADDEEPVRRTAKRVLEHHGFTVLQAADGAEALERLSEGGRDIDLVISDIVMPRIDGIGLYRQARAGGFATPFLFMSGHQNREVLATLGADPPPPFLPKPWTVAELIASVRAILANE